MELGLDFDDSDLIEAPKERKILTSYNAKICTPKWFLTADGVEGHTDPATAYKFQGDYHYRQGDYTSAIQAFSHSLSILGAHNRTMRREVMDSLSRCHLKLGQIHLALELANKMMQDCLTDDQICQALLLQQQIYRRDGQTADEVLMLYKLIHRHSFNATFWLLLARALERIEEGLLGAASHTQEQPTPSTRKVRLQANNTESVCHKCGVTQASAVTETGTRHNQGDTLYAPEVNSDTVLSPPSGSLHSQAGDQCNVAVRKTELSGSHDAHIWGGSDSAAEGQHRSGGQVMGEHITGGQVMGEHIPGEVSTAETTSSKVTGEELEKWDKLLAGLSPRWMQLTCYVRIRLILVTVEDTVGSFVKEKNAQLSKQIEEAIQSLVDDEKTLDTVTKFMETDMFEDTGHQLEEEDQEQKVTEGETSADDFNNRWFSWIRDL